MTVIQISQMTVRQGLSTQLPNSLNEGEFGLATETAELFIGNPSFAPNALRASSGTNPFANTQVLTEWSQNLEKLIRYIYQARNLAGTKRATPQTSTGSVISRFLQERVDEIVSVKSYGATGQGRQDNAAFPGGSFSSAQVTAETYAIRRAALDVAVTLSDPTLPEQYCKRALYFPAGVYVINGPLLIPPGSTWIGDGIQKSIIVMADANQTSVAQVCDGGMTVAELDAGHIALHTEANMTTNLPVDIEISGISFVHLGNKDVVRLYRAADVTFCDCEFLGDYAASDKPVVLTSGIGANYDGTTDSIAVSIDGLGNTLIPQNIIFHRCHFSQCTYGILITGNVRHISITNSQIERCYRGISLGETPVNPGNLTTPSVGPPAGGPSSVCMIQNLFNNIQLEAVSVWTVQSPLQTIADNEGGGFHVSISNRYNDCGYDLDGSYLPLGTPQAPVIRFFPGTAYNTSLSDTFSRNVVTADTTYFTDYRVAYVPTDKNMVQNTQDLFQGNELYDIAAFFPGVPPNSQVILRYTATRPINFAIDFGAIVGGISEATAGVASTGTAIFNVDRAPAITPNTFTTIGTVTFTASAVGTFATTGHLAQSLAQGDVLRIVAPGVADVSLADISITLTASR